ncbi:hypothetical protein ACFWPV_15385 [Streptomyces uncialis]|uniref:hypothetical protein n=1 Tax=Streptomyces uncialis TaxID=1048205 RepID=UPI0036584F36
MPFLRPEATTCPAADAVRTTGPGGSRAARGRRDACAGAAVSVAGRETRSLPVVAADTDPDARFPVGVVTGVLGAP